MEYYTVASKEKLGIFRVFESKKSLIAKGDTVKFIGCMEMTEDNFTTKEKIRIKDKDGSEFDIYKVIKVPSQI
jgi:hypothetical protein